MSKFLVIVESPNKVATIQKYLGNDYNVVASVGHIAKMKTTGLYGLGIDFESWEPLYTIETGKKDVVKKLKELSKDAEKIYIATDPDREGEAIGDHLVEYLKIDDKYERIKYNEITKEAILNALAKPSKVDVDLVDAQKARRMLDRIIGFRLSQLMKRKMSNTPTNPSAGRVQSIALKLVTDREKEIQAFIPEEFYRLAAQLDANLTANYVNMEFNSDKRDWILPSKIEEFKKFFENKNNQFLVVNNIEQKDKKIGAVTPFKQAILYKRSPYNSSTTQSAAQKLYEGYGDGGLISYPRTDSTRLSQTFIDNAKKYIEKVYGKEYVAGDVKGFSGDQDAHEAIRPTDLSLSPEKAKEKYPEMNNYELNVYKTIYINTLQALMSQPIRTIKSYTFNNQEHIFKMSFSKVKFKGYYIINNDYEETLNDPNYELNQKVDVKEFNFTQHFTKPRPRYTEGSLIEALDEIKVGRPSTFATTVKILKDRQYVTNEGSSLVPTEFGTIVLDKLITSFSTIINETYTAIVEEQLDLIAESKLAKNPVMQDFWNRFDQTLNEAANTMERTTLVPVYLEEPCPEDEAQLIIRTNKKGQQFAGCTNFPRCRFTQSVEQPKSSSYKKKSEKQNTEE
ncbi:type I DNA topoisomerase [Mycoplasmopsis alligatoris]|uniref:DNA topoisomerase 1 n=1 Tax=Mycoplasmopsis alligatoris A21JP2 TaxID=747682 RepID=D4XV02_9BACT|nr:type I DNA topoisomerase [Mycoplasmopsis alligatoris]EFF41841.1 DNA topoisomerase [Mycoplasmopsis alligatoris A21JP2]